MYRRVSLLYCFRPVRQKEIGLNFFNGEPYGVCVTHYTLTSRDPLYFHFSIFYFNLTLFPKLDISITAVLWKPCLFTCIHIYHFFVHDQKNQKARKKNLSSKRPWWQGQLFIFLFFYTNVLYISFPKLLCTTNNIFQIHLY